MSFKESSYSQSFENSSEKRRIFSLFIGLKQWYQNQKQTESHSLVCYIFSSQHILNLLVFKVLQSCVFLFKM